MTKALQMMFAVDDIVNNYSYVFDENVLEHQKTLSSLPVEEAMDSISHFFEKNKFGCCIYCVTEFLKRFPEATYGFLPEENPYDNNNRSSSKVVAIVGDEVYDVVYGLEHKKDIYTRNCRINIYAYANMNLKEGESMIILPNPLEHKTENFINYFFNNAQSRVIGTKVTSYSA